VGQLDDAVRAVAVLPADQLEAIDRDLLAVQMLFDPALPEDAGSRTAGRTLMLKDVIALFDLPKDLFLADGVPMGAAQIRKADSAPRQAVARILLRAAMLHTDFLTASSREEMVRSQTRSSLAGRATIRVDDAQRQAVTDVGIYWSCARTAMDFVASTPIGGMLVRDWYVATGEYLVDQRDYAAGVPHLEHGRAVVAESERIALYLGAAYENLASPPIQAAFQSGASAVAIGSRPLLLRRAEFQLRSALLLDPDLADAALRLGRTLFLLARPDEALPILARAEGALLRAPAKYAAALFVGFTQMELGHGSDARLAFQRASALFPDAQSPRLAIAYLDMLASDRVDALAAISALTTTANGPDPWWTYDTDVAWNVRDRMIAVRAGALERLR
jgi:tetratricopeptide (TPR) repeat protein